VALVADIRFACGDNGKRMQPQLVEFIRELAEDAERYRWLRDSPERPCRVPCAYAVMPGDVEHPTPIGGATLDAAIDQARGKGGGGE